MYGSSSLGLTADLRGYQQKAVAWMLQKEKGETEERGVAAGEEQGPLHMFWTELPSAAGRPVYFNSYTGRYIACEVSLYLPHSQASSPQSVELCAPGTLLWYLPRFINSHCVIINPLCHALPQALFSEVQSSPLAEGRDPGRRDGTWQDGRDTGPRDGTQVRTWGTPRGS